MTASIRSFFMADRRLGPSIFDRLDEQEIRAEIARHARRCELLWELVQTIRAERRNDPPEENPWDHDEEQAEDCPQPKETTDDRPEMD